MMNPPDGIDRSRASCNCIGSYLRSSWWSLFGGLGQGLGGLGGGALGNGTWWQNLFGRP